MKHDAANEEIAQAYIDAVSITDDPWTILKMLAPTYGDDAVRRMLWQLIDERRILWDNNRKLQPISGSRPAPTKTFVVSKIIKADNAKHAEMLATSERDGSWTVEEVYADSPLDMSGVFC